MERIRLDSKCTPYKGFHSKGFWIFTCKRTKLFIDQYSKSLVSILLHPVIKRHFQKSNFKRWYLIQVVNFKDCVILSTTVWISVLICRFAFTRIYGHKYWLSLFLHPENMKNIWRTFHPQPTELKPYQQNAEAFAQRCSVKKVFLKIKIHKKTPVPEPLFK